METTCQPSLACTTFGIRFAARFVDGLIVTAGALVYLIPGLVYFVLRDIKGGASIGRRAFKLVVVDATSIEPIDSMRAVVRGLLQLIQCFTIGIWPLVDLVLTVTRPDRCTSIDLIMNTRVIKQA
jgi:uncharacterized RDD family membrane protein YckC